MSLRPLVKEESISLPSLTNYLQESMASISIKRVICGRKTVWGSVNIMIRDAIGTEQDQPHIVKDIQETSEIYDRKGRSDVKKRTVFQR
jgi:hypothetical protein